MNGMRINDANCTPCAAISHMEQSAGRTTRRACKSRRVNCFDVFRRLSATRRERDGRYDDGGPMCITVTASSM
jgi:hypothetical protein